MDAAFANKLNGSQHHSFGVLRHMRLVILLLMSCVVMFMSGVCESKESCPWLNEATAAGILEGSVTVAVTHNNSNKEDASCEFIRQQKSVATVLRIEVATMTESAGTFASYAARCGSNGTPLKAIGNEAVVCSVEVKKRQVGEQVVGRVRNRAFIVSVSSNADSAESSELREKARRVAEQVAGFLF
jgi:hypothetical protein